MIKFENQCVDCGLPCIGSACKYIHVPCFYCDECGYETDTYHYDGKQLCIDCIEKRLDKVSIDDYDDGNWEEEYDGYR